LNLNNQRRIYILQIKFSNKGSTLIASINGELDHHTIEYVREKIDSEIMKSTTKNLIFDFSNVNFMDSSGIGVIMGRYKNITKVNGKAALINVNAHVKRILEMSGVLKIVPIYDNIENAINRM
jgi:stage II sporulation protein AA (anti-sigma F factor antagonist)